MVIPAENPPSASAVAAPRLEYPSPAQHSSTVSTGRNALPLMEAEDPAGPFAGEIETEAAAAGAAVVT
jgi:hypothetical protein